MGKLVQSGLFLSIFSKIKPYLAMVSLQFGYAGMYIVTMLCLKHGLSHYVLTVYRHAFATIAVAPFALVFERKVRPKMTISTFLKINVLALLEPVIDQNLYYVGMRYTSASFSAAIFNVLPAVTFIMALIFRLEKVKIKNIRSQAKILGTIITLGGAMLMTLYKGPIVKMVWSNGGSHHQTAAAATSSDAGQHWVVGTLMLLGSCTGWGAFFILQSFTVKNYPAELSLATLICLMGTLQGAVAALVMERDFSAWAIGWDSRLLAPIYNGVICSAIPYYVQSMMIKERGPVFVTAFNPLIMVIVAALGSLILKEVIHLGSVIGAIIIVVGLYCVIWGKSKDESLTLKNEKGSGDHHHQEILPISSTKIDESKRNTAAAAVVNSNGNVIANGGSHGTVILSNSI